MPVTFPCVVCGETVVKPRHDEEVVRGETVGEHVAETGHHPTFTTHVEPRYISEDKKEAHHEYVRQRYGGGAPDYPVIAADEIYVGDDDMEGVVLAAPAELWANFRTGEDVADEITRLLNEGLSAAEALDYHMVKERGMTNTEWADERGVSLQAVSKNVTQAREKLHD